MTQPVLRTSGHKFDVTPESIEQRCRDVIRAVFRHYEISNADLRRRDAPPRVQAARCAAVGLCRTVLGASLQDIGDIIGAKVYEVGQLEEAHLARLQQSKYRFQFERVRQDLVDRWLVEDMRQEALAKKRLSAQRRARPYLA